MQQGGGDDDFHMDNGLDRADDQEDGGLDQGSKIDQIDCDKDANNDGGIEIEDLRGSYEGGPDVLSAFLSKLSSQEQHRYEAFRRAHLTKSTVKRLVQSIIGHGIAGSTVIVVQSAGKLFVGELVKAALEVMEEHGEDGPLQLAHIREAVSRIRQRSSFFRSPFFEPETML